MELYITPTSVRLTIDLINTALAVTSMTKITHVRINGTNDEAIVRGFNNSCETTTPEREVKMRQTEWSTPTDPIEDQWEIVECKQYFGDDNMGYFDDIEQYD